ncbi:MAG: sigma-E processing peptidase SpoIIGA [Bacilli bacterium]|nr:sigma-E processing peptidase SpoIIGA [Bacilli bacterium]MDD4053554.1 sigma-E processing peptidase SpoIIGA [Bacilli bacterium]MDD4411479.1 sigma-E processing peptidase SpoIIGA [Bacilli bacterium]
MKVYIDLILLLNFLFDFLLLLTVGILLRRNASLKRITLGALIGSFSVICLFLDITSFQLFVFKIVTSILMVIVSFKYRDLKYTFRNILYLYISSIILGGFLYLLNVEFAYKQDGLIFYHNGLSINWIVLLITSPAILYLYLKQGLYLKNNYSNYYLVDIYLKDGKISVNAFLDTGNNLTDPYRQRPIILVSKRELKCIYNDEDIILVPYETLNHQGILKCLRPEKIDILGIGVRKNLLIGISEEKFNIDGIDCILHTKLLEG